MRPQRPHPVFPPGALSHPQCPGPGVGGDRGQPRRLKMRAVGALVPRGRVSQRGEVGLGGGVDQVTQNRIGAEVLARFAQTARPCFQESALVGPQDRGVDVQVLDGQSGAAIAGRPAQCADVFGGQPHLRHRRVAHPGMGRGDQIGEPETVERGQHGPPQSERTLGRCCRGRGVGPGEGARLAVTEGDHARGGEQPHLLAQQHQFLGVGERRLCLVWTAHPLRQNPRVGVDTIGQRPRMLENRSPAPGARRHDRVQQRRARQRRRRGGQHTQFSAPRRRAPAQFGGILTDREVSGGQPRRGFHEQLDAEPYPAVGAADGKGAAA